MYKIIILLLVTGSCFLVLAAENNSTKKDQNIREKALFLNKDHYQKILKKTSEEKNKKKMKVYKRKDGSIDTLKTIYEANH